MELKWSNYAEMGATGQGLFLTHTCQSLALQLFLDLVEWRIVTDISELALRKHEL